MLRKLRLDGLLLAASLAFTAAPALAAAPEKVNTSDTAEDQDPGKERELVSSKGKLHSRNPIVKMLMKHDPVGLEAARKWAEDNKTSISGLVNISLPEDVERAALTYVRLAGAGHPDALLYGLSNKNYSPPHTLAPGVDVMAYAHELIGGATMAELEKERAGMPAGHAETPDGRTQIRRIDAKATVLRAKVQEILGTDNGRTFLEGEWKTVQAHSAESHLQIVTPEGAPTAPEVQNLARSIHGLHIDAAIERHVIQRALSSDGGIRQMNFQSQGLLPLPGVAEGLAQQKAEGQDGSDPVAPMSNRKAFRKLAGRGAAIGLPVAAGLWGAGSVARSIGNAHPNGAWAVGGRVVDAAAKGIAATWASHLVNSIASRPAAISFEQNIRDGKVPGTEPSLMYDEDFQKFLKTVKRSVRKEPSMLATHIDEYLQRTKGEGLTAEQKTNIGLHGESAVARPSPKDLRDHVMASVIKQNSLSKGTELSWGFGAAATFGAVLINEDDATATALIATTAAKRLPPIAGAMVVGARKAAPYRNAIAAIGETARAEDRTPSWYTRWRRPAYTPRALPVASNDDAPHTTVPAPAGARRATPVRDFFRFRR